MTQPRKLIPKPTMGLGDCAFHAYDRAFWKEPVINQIETNLVKHGKTPGSAFAYFIIIAAKHKFIQLPEDLTNLPLEEAIMKANEYNFEAKWKEIKEKIFELRKQNEENFQLMLAPIMRELTLFWAEKDDKENNRRHYHRTIQPLVSAFRDYALNTAGVNISGVKDDIYKRHDHISRAFEDLSNGLFHGQVDLQRYGALKTATNRTKEETTELNQLEKQLDDVFQEKEVALLAWWAEEGYDTFMANMKKPGQWAGDLELGQLGRFWGANVDGYKNDNPHHIHIEHGTISLDKEKESYLLENKNGKKMTYSNYPTAVWLIV